MNTLKPTNSMTWKTWLLGFLPLFILGSLIYLFLQTNAGLDLQPPAPVEQLAIERFVLTPEGIEAYVRNTGPQELTLAQVIVNDAIWSATVTPSPTLPRLSRATVIIPFPWVQNEAYSVKLITSNSLVFTGEISVAFETPKPATATFWSFTLIGIYVGVIPVFLGLLWFPALRQLGYKWMGFLLSLTAGLLLYLGFDAAKEALEIADRVPSPFQGIGLVAMGMVLTFLLLDAIGRRQSAVGRNEATQRLTIAYLIALGIGLHNLGEGLAIGAAYSVGALALGTFLVIGFIIQNITEGLGIIAPILRDRPSLAHLFWMGLLGGVPAILGAWIGGFTYSAPLAVLFLSIGAGAVFEVVYEIAKLLAKDTKTLSPALNFAGVTAGMLIMYVTGLLVK
jgi:zinc transporter ZupT